MAGFMRPIALFFDAAQAAEYCCDASNGCDAPCADHGAGWYSHLSAPGYMDCTEWAGPYTTGEAALRACMDAYEVTLDGDDRSEPDGLCPYCSDPCGADDGPCADCAQTYGGAR